jgi:hypothetical protein
MRRTDTNHVEEHRDGQDRAAATNQAEGEPDGSTGGHRKAILEQRRFHQRPNVATLNAVCLADFGDDGIAFIAQPEIPPRNVNWSSQGKWVHLAKIGFEKYFLSKVRRGRSDTFYERMALEALGIAKLKKVHLEPAE